MNEYLKHYGILGMKWGVRKERQRTPSDALVVRKGSIIRRLSTVDNERLADILDELKVLK